MSGPFSVFLKTGSRQVEELHNYGLKKKHETSILTSFRNVAQLVQVDLIKTINTGVRTGRMYTYRGQRYQASAPGESPASRSGKLASLFGYIINTKRLQIYNDAKNDGAPYPFFLEEGTVKMESRPYFTKTIEARAEDLRSQLSNITKE
jgi:hypothetical protein